MAVEYINPSYQRIKLKRDTTANWNAATTFIPLEGEIILYTDYYTDSGGVIHPNLKVGNGSSLLSDLPFVIETQEAASNYIVADPFNTTAGSSYSVGDYVIYNDKLYKCVADTTSGDFIVAHWSETTVSDHMTNLAIHVTAADKENWDNKVSARYSSSTLILEN